MDEEMENRLSLVERRLDSIDTQVDAAEQALAARDASDRNKEKIRDLDERLEILVRSFNAISCILTGAMLLWFGNSLNSDTVATNDRIAEWLMMGGGGCVGYGLLVLTNNESRVLGWIESVNPWRR